MGTIGVHAAHSGKARVQSDKHVETLSFPDLTDDEAIRTHAKCLLHEASQRNLAMALEVGLPTLQTNDVTQGKLKFKDFLDSHDPFA